MSNPADSHSMSRRQWLARCGQGIGLLGLAALSENVRAREATAAPAAANPLAAKPMHFKPRARRVIHLWMNGAPSQVDTFDPKPALLKYAGQRPASTANLKTENGTGGLMPSPFKFQKYGQGGVEISELFPNLAQCADDLCVIRSMHTDVPVHESSNWMMFTGNITPVRPSYGSWLLYGLGTENQNLPGFVVLGEGQPVNGPSNWSSRFLPGIYQGCQVALTREYDPRNVIPYLHNTAVSQDSQRRQLNLIQDLNRFQIDRQGQDAALSARIESLELAFRMQAAAEAAFDVSKESPVTLAMYGLTGPDAGMIGSAENTVDRTIYARNCLLARRLVERGVRVVQVYCGKSQPWDTHSNNNSGHQSLAKVVDQPVAALLKDLKQRGLLEDTLVVCGGEFGRTPTSQGSNGRDHNHYGFTTWLAGGGVKGGFTYGATDEFGFTAVENKVHVHDLHATMLYLMGLDHERLTYRHAGRDYRLTDVYGKVVGDIIA